MNDSDLGRLVVARTAGSAGPEVVLLPGLAVARYLLATQDLLAATCRTSLLHYPGTGPAPNGPKRALGLVEDVAALASWLSSNGSGRAVLVGHSYGAMVAPQLAVTVPERVGAIVLVSPAIDPAFRTWPRLAAAFVRNALREPGKLAKVQRGEQRRAGVRRIVAMTRSMLGDDVEPWLGATPVPVTVVRGSLDALSTPAWAARLATRPGGELVEVPGVPHAFPFDHPEALADAVRSTLVRMRS